MLAAAARRFKDVAKIGKRLSTFVLLNRTAAMRWEKFSMLSTSGESKFDFSSGDVLLARAGFAVISALCRKS